MTKKLYSFDDHPEHKAKLAEHRDFWIANAMSTKAMDDEDKKAMCVAMKGLYEAAGIPWHGRVVFAPSPLVVALASSFAAAIWYMRKNGVPGGEKKYVNKKARDYAESPAGLDVVSPILEHTVASVDTATHSSVGNSVVDFGVDVEDATDAILNKPADTSRLSSEVKFMLACAKNYYRMRNGGNQWSGWCAYLSFFDRVANLNLPIYEKWRHYESAAIHGGPRAEHKEFVIISDRPEILKVDEQNRPHCDDGPSHRWRDGWSLYHVHGVKVPEWVIEHPEQITIEKIRAEKNAEVRRVMRERFGEGRYLMETKAKLIHADHEVARKGAAPRVLLEDDEGRKFLVGTDGSTARTYYMEVPSTVSSCAEAHRSLCGFDERKIVNKS